MSRQGASRPSAWLDTVPRSNACLGSLGLVPCLAIVPRPSALTCLDKVPRPNVMPNDGASALCHYMPRQGVLT